MSRPLLLAERRTRAPLVVLGALLLTIAAAAGVVRTTIADESTAAHASTPPPPTGPRVRWPVAVVELARSLPIQEAGRVMPLAQWARYTLLRLNHRGSVVDSSGRTLEPVEWALDVMFRPEEAAKYEVFLVDTSEVLDAVGYRHADGKKKRDRYSYHDLAPVHRALSQKADTYEGTPDARTRVDPKKRSPVEGGIVALAGNIQTFLDLVHLSYASKFEASLEHVPTLHELFGSAKSVRASDVFAHFDGLRDGVAALTSIFEAAPSLRATDLFWSLGQMRGADPLVQASDVHARLEALRERGGAIPDVRAFRTLALLARAKAFPPFEELRAAGRESGPARARDALALLSAMSEPFDDGRLLSMVPPEGARTSDETWLSPRTMFDRAFTRGGLEPGHLAMLRDLEALSTAAEADDMSAATRALQDFHGRSMARATARGEYEKIGLEVFLLRLEPFFWARLLYLAAFVLVAVTWLWRQRFVVWATWAFVSAGLAIHVLGIVLRCVLHSRPPVTTLYETTLFISAFAVLGFAVLERIHRRGFGLALAPFFGTLGLFVSNRYETISADDPMPQLVAVLDTNFWLATHVTCVTIGYSATLIASGIAHVQVFAQLFGWKKGDADFHRHVTKATYGTLAFALVFSTVGTILGGIWANESWGRFWGWDPKENGALLIVLAQLAVLHGRMGGFLKSQGVALGTIGCGAIVVFSWWGVNLLGVGLHSYGFTAGLWTGLLAFWGIEALVLAAGIFVKRPA